MLVFHFDFVHLLFCCAATNIWDSINYSGFVFCHRFFRLWINWKGANARNDFIKMVLLGILVATTTNQRLENSFYAIFDVGWKQMNPIDWLHCNCACFGFVQSAANLNGKKVAFGKTEGTSIRNRNVVSISTHAASSKIQKLFFILSFDTDLIL